MQIQQFIDVLSDRSYDRLKNVFKDISEYPDEYLKHYRKSAAQVPFQTPGD